MAMLGLATRVPKVTKNTKSAITPELINGWIISQFLSWVYLIRIHDIIHRFLI
jgi:hypothetical protein